MSTPPNCLALITHKVTVTDRAHGVPHQALESELLGHSIAVNVEQVACKSTTFSYPFRPARSCCDQCAAFPQCAFLQPILDSRELGIAEDADLVVAPGSGNASQDIMRCLRWKKILEAQPCESSSPEHSAAGLAAGSPHFLSYHDIGDFAWDSTQIAAMSSSRDPKRKNDDRDDKPVSPPPIKRKVQSTTTKDAVSSFFKPTSQKPPEPITWSERSVNEDTPTSLIVGKYIPPGTPAASSDAPPAAPKKKIAAFDLDWTLVKSASGKRFVYEAGDWKWWNPNVPKLLKKLYHEEGFIVVIISNQGAITLHPDRKAPSALRNRLESWKGKVASILRTLDIPTTIYTATAFDNYRKPRTGIGFADNIGIPLFTPEEYFLNEKPREYARSFEPSEYVNAATVNGEPVPPLFVKSNEQEIVLFVGSPASGKSTFYTTHLSPHYTRINQDLLKTRDKCLKTARTALEAGKSVAVDNTNADEATRAYWVKLAKEMGVGIRHRAQD
ncbi:hypothetical protein V497_07402 [Pseudogymnoascus sp. VKM F-4516 (FW-969)]|nr:hypothetical protein V497_07402 [Pseudogymnoascus sp. VKM F-4516 (FW-969)]